jgi:5'(3')-deoxyribonucleotidase
MSQREGTWASGSDGVGKLAGLTPISSSIMARRPRVLLDVDGVVADFVQLMVNAVRNLNFCDIPINWRPTKWDVAKELKLTDKQEDEVYDVLRLPGSAKMLLPFPGAVEGVKRIASMFDVAFVTTPVEGSQTWCFDRTEWLITHFGEELGNRWVFTDHKYLVFGDFLVDDKPENCLEFKRAWPMCVPLRWLSPGMSIQKGLVHVSTWKEVEFCIKQWGKRISLSSEE